MPRIRVLPWLLAALLRHRDWRRNCVIGLGCAARVSHWTPRLMALAGRLCGLIAGTASSADTFVGVGGDQDSVKFRQNSVK